MIVLRVDNTSERVVQDALDKAKEGRTTIVIAHRLSTIRHADLIIGFDRGQMIEQGTHEELITLKGLYYELVMVQSRKEEEDPPESDDDDERTPISRQQTRKEANALEKVEHQSSGFVPGSNAKQPIESVHDVDDYEDDDDENDPTTNENSTKKKCRFRMPFFLRMLKLNAPEWHWILLGSVCSLLNGSVHPIFALLLSHIFRLFAEPDLDEQKRLTSIYAGMIFCVGAASGLADFLTATSFAKSGEALTMRMRRSTFSSLLRQEMSYFDHETNSLGALVTRLSTDSSALKVRQTDPG